MKICGFLHPVTGFCKLKVGGLEDWRIGRLEGFLRPGHLTSNTRTLQLSNPPTLQLSNISSFNCNFGVYEQEISLLYRILRGIGSSILFCDDPVDPGLRKSRAAGAWLCTAICIYQPGRQGHY